MALKQHTLMPVIVATQMNLNLLPAAAAATKHMHAYAMTIKIVFTHTLCVYYRPLIQTNTLFRLRTYILNNNTFIRYQLYEIFVDNFNLLI